MGDDRTIFVFGEPLVELSGLEQGVAHIGVGGDTFNTSVYLARRGAKVQYVSAIGDDPVSQLVAQALADEGIGTDYLSVVPGKPVGLYAIKVDEVGERSFTYWRSASAFRSWFSSDRAPAALEAMKSSSALYLSGITLSVFDREERSRIVALVAEARRAGAWTAFDTNYRPAGWPLADTARVAINDIKPHISISMPTFEDEADLFGADDPHASLAFWQAAGCEEVCVKSGPRGALVSGGHWVAPQEVRRPLDTTGAGDSFNGAYLAARLQGATPAEAAKAGNELAGEVIMCRGAILPRTVQSEA